MVGEWGLDTFITDFFQFLRVTRRTLHREIVISECLNGEALVDALRCASRNHVADATAKHRLAALSALRKKTVPSRSRSLALRLPRQTKAGDGGRSGEVNRAHT